MFDFQNLMYLRLINVQKLLAVQYYHSIYSFCIRQLLRSHKIRHLTFCIIEFIIIYESWVLYLNTRSYFKYVLNYYYKIR